MAGLKYKGSARKKMKNVLWSRSQQVICLAGVSALFRVDTSWKAVVARDLRLDECVYWLVLQSRSEPYYQISAGLLINLTRVATISLDDSTTGLLPRVSLVSPRLPKRLSTQSPKSLNILK